MHHAHITLTHAPQEVTETSTVSTKHSPISITTSKPPSTKQVPIRKFTLQPDVARALTNKVEQQKLALRQKQHPYVSKNIYTPNVRQTATHSSSTVTKKRKVASVPSPRAYSGFSLVPSGTQSTGGWKPQPNVPKPSSTTRARSLSTTANKPKEDFVSKTGNTTEKVRKVRRMTSVDSGTVTKPSGIITTSSWRSGKQLTDKILGEKQTREVSPPLAQSSTSSLFSSVDVSSSSLPQKSSRATREDEPFSTWTKESSKRKFEDILADLDSPLEDQQPDDKDAGSKRPCNTASRAKVPKKKPKVVNGKYTRPQM